ncbi:comEC/Rec2-related domain protein [Orientia chuto str. Dubai]|uniref:ComEC/Rec2-related domain protein n=1 Tax=Orientia chuto str. Dubai TaxID=1359168 RepID=A0A0F3MNP8_9RICK|nr:ComEC/Rec2 family competence protein [Candidatus Orientia mediorientalis]KJV57286.1 comEC/Rec2-related domain protein [Orientia chuto str. Dubai]
MVIHLVNKLISEEYHNLGLWFIVSFIFGIALYFTLPFEPELWQILLISPILISIFLITSNSFLERTLLLILLCCYLGVIVGKIRYLIAKPRHINTIIKSKIYGTITQIHPTPQGVILIINNCYIEALDNYNTPINIRVSAFKNHVYNIITGDQVAFSATLYPPTSNALIINNLSLNILAYFNNINAIGYVTSSVKLVQSNSQNNVFNKSMATIIEHIRIGIYDRVINVLDSYLGGFINAILLGENYALNKDIIISMRQAGISHILCISGLHLSMVAITLFTGFRFILNLSTTIAFNFDVRTIATIMSLIGSFCYLILTGSHIATIRAFIMTSTAIVVVLIRRGMIPLRSVGLAAIIILLSNPEYVMHPSFSAIIYSCNIID